MTPQIRVLVADDHAVVRSGLRALLDTVDDMEMVGEAGDGQTAVELADELLPDIVLMDVQMPTVNGIEATRAIAAAHPSVAVIILTMYEDSDTLFAALRAGARGYLLKGADQTDVLYCLRSVAAGHVTLGPGAAERVLERFSTHESPPVVFPELTDRERSVLQLVADGHNNAVIGRQLGLATKTVANHVSNILTKLQFADRAEAIVRARQAGLADDSGPSDGGARR
ncbi:MAG: response regulator transcription factor [Acidimicrobiales bacterium]|nr:response regulator transcription factor [Acidimicrobiales bacterium]